MAAWWQSLIARRPRTLVVCVCSVLPPIPRGLSTYAATYTQTRVSFMLLLCTRWRSSVCVLVVRVCADVVRPRESMSSTPRMYMSCMRSHMWAHMCAPSVCSVITRSHCGGIRRLHCAFGIIQVCYFRVLLRQTRCGGVVACGRVMVAW